MLLFIINGNMVKFINISVNFSGGKIHPFRVFEILLKSGFTSYCHMEEGHRHFIVMLIGTPRTWKILHGNSNKRECTQNSLEKLRQHIFRYKLIPKKSRKKFKL